MTTTIKHRPLPEALTRSDVAIGEWSVGDCSPVRGEPVTNIGSRKMKAPHHDDELGRVIRAHEMIHAKVSPLDLDEWEARGFATTESLVACEELRVNTLLRKAGFDPKLLTDGGEAQMGERLVAMNAWDDAVRFAIACAGTGSAKPFIKGIRKHNPMWASVLDSVIKEAEKKMKSWAKASDFTNTTGHDDVPAPYGFHYTENLARWVDTVCENAPKPKEEPTNKSDGESTDKGDGESTDKGDDTPRKRGRPRKGDERKPDYTLPPRPGTDYVPSWDTLVVANPPLTVVHAGRMGKRRIASNVGRNPRRMYRMVSDPHKRVFDTIVRGKGAMVVVDCSGSTHFTASDVSQILDNAPGATVLAYTVLDTYRGSDEPLPNAWVLAKNGRIVGEMPFEQGCGNGVDYPALVWAVNNRKRNEPILWVCDGMVTGVKDRPHKVLSEQCAKFVTKNGIITAKDLPSALTKLTEMRKGKKPTSDKLSWYLH